MPTYNVLASILIKDETDINGADISASIDAKNEKEAIKIVKKKISDLSNDHNTSKSYSIQNYEYDKNEGLTVTISIENIPEFEWITVLFDTDDEVVDYTDVDELIANWIFEFFDSNEYKIQLIDCDEV
jgi:hypothetical protein